MTSDSALLELREAILNDDFSGGNLSFPSMGAGGQSHPKDLMVHCHSKQQVPRDDPLQRRRLGCFLGRSQA